MSWPRVLSSPFDNAFSKLFGYGGCETACQHWIIFALKPELRAFMLKSRVETCGIPDRSTVRPHKPRKQLPTAWHFLSGAKLFSSCLAISTILM
jgi:hypothetical protein